MEENTNLNLGTGWGKGKIHSLKGNFKNPPPEADRPLTQKEIAHTLLVCKKYYLTDNVKNIFNSKGNWHYVFAVIDEEEILVGFIPYGITNYENPKSYMQFQIPFPSDKYTDPKIIAEIQKIEENVRFTIEKFGSK